ncbi:Protein-S-isoprenylcysteine O-methyltransferase Ste14 [Arachidicoccus rhizosphaerae]|jgi:protein-S-isoprenylcysteine O-methyltransferase Ste14|uniref:Protein-S-isoprenylcysteine O-methyltransferase Ste14 n=1 Tax=Arachidicoccus rhizosphaerae TaxID=551991 RepID=A0A1H4CCP9_9BACT|nr:isoprenylcysteine carboxylmethyltransferase family protein [Arachidicoccus rhizosphaerae]SEA58118.1 Protein-S-isoprenylcysteine O-methyltransferase Ste14 [Arachidicoccus rhizosphaerae]
MATTEKLHQNYPGQVDAQVHKDHPGVYIPPPLFYIAFFYFSLLLEHDFALGIGFLRRPNQQFIGWVLCLIGVGVGLMTLIQFIRSRNSIVTIKSAHSLQTSGVYRYSRNPLYVSLFFLYFGAAIFWGNWWSFILSPFLVMIMKLYVIKREEKYLRRRFGKEYKLYKKSVRRWF